MKQTITKEQWEELTIEQSAKIVDFMGGTMSSEYPLTIGQMIEFLGDDWIELLLKHNKKGYYVTNRLSVDGDGSPEFFGDNNNLCDELWEAVKLKLCQT